MKIRLQDGHSFKNLLYVFVVLTILRSGKCSTDPCVGVQSLGDSRRTATEEPGTCAGICDNDIREDWYRLDAFNSGARMPESSVKVCHCGTYIPIWLNGSHPTPENPGPVTIPVCAQLKPGGPICEWQDKIDVKRCYAGIEYFIYKLKPTPFCDMAYCGGARISCANNGSWNDITKSCTNPRTPPLNVRPTLSAPYISSTKAVTDDTGKTFIATQFSMKCTLSYTQQTVDNGARYDVIFQSGDQVVYTKTLKSTDSPVVEMNESYLAGRVGQTVICNVTSYWQSQFPTRSPYQFSNNAYTLDIYFTWPTKSGITKSEANDACNSSITQSAVYNLCVIDLQLNVTQLIQLCMLDLQISDDKVFPPSILATQMEVICKWTIDRAYNGTTSSVRQEYVANVCPKQCSQNGKCNNGKCTCNTGYMSDDCSIQVPEIQSLAPATCDVRTSPTSCREVQLYATGVSSDHPVCQIKNGTKEVIFLDMSPSVSGGLVTCNLPQVPVNPGIAFSETVVSYTVYVSISNDATPMKFSNEMKFIIYDGLCVTCDVSSGCQNTRTACNILGRCYENATVMYCGNNNTDPRVCNPTVSNTKWLPINCADESKGSTTC